MKVLFVSAWFPSPPDNGSRIRAYNLLKALARRHDVYLISLLQADSDPENAHHLADMCKVVSLHRSRWFEPGTLRSMLGFFSNRPRSFVDTYNPEVKRAVNQAIQDIEPDIIIASTLGVVEYIPSALSCVTILDEHNCEYAVLKRSAARTSGFARKLRAELGWRKFARWEAGICRKYDQVIMVSEEDRRQILLAVPDLEEIAVVPNGVDTEHYRPEGRLPDPNRLLYNGALTYGANLGAVQFYASEIYPVLRQSRPEVVLRVTGRVDGVDLGLIGECPGVELTGYVPDVRDELRTAAVCLVPLQEGGGSRLKILEAFAAGVPVVSTSVGVEGIDARNGEHLLVADTPADLAAAVDRLLNDRELARDLVQSARSLVEARYSWNAIGMQFVDIIERLHARLNGGDVHSR